MRSIDFVVEGEPVGQGRPRFARHGRYVQTYDPPKSKKYKALVAQKLKQVYFNHPIEKAVKIEIKAYFGVPKSYTKKRKLACLSGRKLPTKKPDADNIEKGIMDAMSKIAYVDDKQVIELHTTKMYAEKARVEVHIEEVGD